MVQRIPDREPLHPGVIPTMIGGGLLIATIAGFTAKSINDHFRERAGQAEPPAKKLVIPRPVPEMGSQTTKK